MSHTNKRLSAPAVPDATQKKERAEAFPTTRYLGSKRKLLPLLQRVLSGLRFETALDGFTGTGVVAYLLKTLGKRVTASDILVSNVACVRALVENNTEHLGTVARELVTDLRPLKNVPGFIEDTFDGIFFNREENRFLDTVLPRIHALRGYQRDLALFALFQAALAKRPYNLFHRANLYMRTRDVKRSFGNKTTWDRPFPELFLRFAESADRAVFSSDAPCHAIHGDVLSMPANDFDLVYLDPPYVSSNHTGVDYLDYYHFLEGLTHPLGWDQRILHRYKHKPLAGRGTSPWCAPNQIEDRFAMIVDRFRNATIVISYRSDGIPSIDSIAQLLEKATGKATVVDAGKYTYALSRNQKSREVVIIGANR